MRSIIRGIRFTTVVLGLAVAALGCTKSGQPVSEGPIAITVDHNGFTPNTFAVKAGAPVVLKVTRTSDATCATELVLKEEGINQKLPLNETVEIQFTPKKKGKLAFACGMDMFKGEIVVQ